MRQSFTRKKNHLALLCGAFCLLSAVPVVAANDEDESSSSVPSVPCKVAQVKEGEQEQFFPKQSDLLEPSLDADYPSVNEKTKQEIWELFTKRCHADKKKIIEEVSQLLTLP